MERGMHRNPRRLTMQTHTIEPPRWKSTLDSLSRVYDGAHASLEILAPDLGAQYEVEDQPLRGISYDDSGIEIHFTVRGGHFAHRIQHPKQVQIEERDDGRIAALDIRSDNEPRTVLRFQDPVASKLLPSASE